MALSGSTVVRATTQNNLVFFWEAVQDVAANSSQINWELRLEALSYGQIVATPGSPWSVTVDGQTFSGTSSLAIGNNETKVLASGSVKLDHAADGSRSFNYSFSQDFWINFGGENITVVSGSGSAVLDTIARASTPSVSASSVELGKPVTIYTNRIAGTGFTHKLIYQFMGVSDTIADNVGDSAQWFTALDLAKQIPNTVSGTAVITCQTYSGNTLIGSKQVTLTLTVPASVVPTVSFTYTDRSAAMSRFGTLVQNISSIIVDGGGTGAYGSAIVSTALTLSGKPYGGGVIKESGSLVLTLSATDSRGRTGSASETMSVAAYQVPGLTLSASRCTSDGTADDTGDHAKITAKCHITQIDGKNRGHLMLPLPNDGDGLSPEIEVPFDTEDFTYEHIVYADPDATMAISATLSDRLASTERSMTLSTGYATLDLLAGGKGIAFGKAATREGFDCAMPAYFTGGLNGFVEHAAYPGCYYRMVDGVGEWLDPPMQLNTEYRTTERYEGKPVYTALVDFGALPASGLKGIDYGIAGSKVIGLEPVMYNSSGNFIPAYSYTGSAKLDWWVNPSGAIMVQVYGDMSNYTAVVRLKYTKA